MKTIGILTYQDALNFGAAFQCKALYQFVANNDNRFDVLVLDYANKAIFQKTDSKPVLSNRSIDVKNKIKMLINAALSNIVKRRFAAFYKDVFFSEKILSNEFHKAEQICDYFIIGSDQLWNFELNGGDVNYLLPEINKDKVITYATSIGQEMVPQKYIDIFVNNIRDIKYISVREQTAKLYINRLLLEKEIGLVLDPVFLLERDYWLKYISYGKKKKGVSCYLFHKEFLQETYEIMRKLNIDHASIRKICGGITVKDILNPRVKTGLLYGPTDALNAIYGSEVIFTDSFHCVALSIIYHVDFYVFLTGDLGRDSRIMQLLDIAGLPYRVVQDKFDYTTKIDWKQVDERIGRMRLSSQNYLIEALRSFKY